MLPPAGGILADFNKYRYKSHDIPATPGHGNLPNTSRHRVSGYVPTRIHQGLDNTVHGLRRE